MTGETQTKPKCLVKVAGRPLIDWQLAAYHDLGITDIGVVTGYKSQMLEEYPIKKFHNSEWASTNMVYSLLAARDWLESDECIIGYSDLFFLAPGLIPLRDSVSNLSVLFDPNWRQLWEMRFDNPLSDAETFRINDKSLITEIGYKAKTIEEIQGQYMGLIKIAPEAWGRVLNALDNLSLTQVKNLQMTHLLQLLIEAKSLDVCSIPYFGFWSEVDSQTDLALLNSQLPFL
jgi:choline kinase